MLTLTCGMDVDPNLCMDVNLDLSYILTCGMDVDPPVVWILTLTCGMDVNPDLWYGC